MHCSKGGQTMIREIRKKSFKISTAVLYLLMAVVAVLSVIPVLFVLAVSLTGEEAIRMYGYQLIPKNFTLEAYRFVFIQAGDIFSAYKVTMTVTILGTLMSLLVTALLAYPLSRNDFVLRRSLSFYVYFTLLFSGGIVPTYILVSKYLHLRDSLLALILPLMVPAFNVLLLRNFFATVPAEIIESAKIDGSGEYRTFFTIVIPVSLPGLATIGLFSSLAYWNDWFNSMLYIDTSSKYPLQFLLQRIMNTIDFIKNTNDPQMRQLELPQESARMAMSIMAMGPIVLAYPFFQKYFVRGLTVGAVKG